MKLLRLSQNMAKGTLIISNLKVDPSWFFRGELVFEKSGHSLTYSNGYYVCSQKQKNNCLIKEEDNFKVATLERNFDRLINDLKLDEATARKIFYDIERSSVDVIEKYWIKRDEIIKSMKNDIVLMEQELKSKGKIKPSDLTSFKNHYRKTIRLTYIFYLLHFLKQSLLAIGKPDIKNEEFAECMLNSIEKIYISDKGKILKIKFEGIFDYLLAIIKSKSPDYLNNFKIPIIERAKFDNLNLLKVIENFERNEFRDTINYFPFGSKYKEDKQIKDTFELMKNAEPKELIKSLNFLIFMSKTSGALLDFKMYTKNNSGSIIKELAKNKGRFGKALETSLIGFN